MAQAAGIIAIDGQVAAGKTAAGRELARRLACPYLDTGIMYRAVAWQARRDGINPSDAAALGRLAVDHPIQFKAGDYTVVLMAGQELSGELRTPEMDRWAAMIARAVPVRRELVRQQRAIAAKAGRIVMVGRDIGAVALPNADLKIYMRAAPEVRARRRYAEMTAQGQSADYDQVLAAAQARDASDSNTARYYHQALPDAAAATESAADAAAATESAAAAAAATESAAAAAAATESAAAAAAATESAAAAAAATESAAAAAAERDAAATDPVQAPDAWTIDTDHYTVAEVVDLILEKLAAIRGGTP